MLVKSVLGDTKTASLVILVSVFVTLNRYLHVNLVYSAYIQYKPMLNDLFRVNIKDFRTMSMDCVFLSCHVRVSE